jgi:putative drug exporter of the RND superfamily
MSAVVRGKGRSIARFVTGRRSKYLVVLFALLVAGGLGSQAGNVVLTSDPAALLPEGAESVRAQRAIERFPSGDVTSAVIVATRPGGVTDADREALRGLATDVPGAGDASPPQASQSGDVAVVVVPFTDLGEDELVAAVATLRERLAALEGGGLETHLTGGAGFAADVSDVFGGINGVLLIGAAGIVLILLVVIYRSPVFWLIPFFTVLLAEGASRGTQYLLGEAGFSITGQAAGTASVLVFGAATDYALLLVARYREELERQEDTHAAMRTALRSAGPAILASGGRSWPRC